MTIPACLPNALAVSVSPKSFSPGDLDAKADSMDKVKRQFDFQNAVEFFECDSAVHMKLSYDTCAVMADLSAESTSGRKDCMLGLGKPLHLKFGAGKDFPEAPTALPR